MSRLISRDPFGRTELHRRQDTGFTVDRTNEAESFGERLYQCDNCGMCRHTPKGHPFTYRYGTYRDGIRTQIEWETKSFCSLGCRNDYYHSKR
jgi:hypothetical protein